MKTMMTKLKLLAIVGITMGLALGAQADNEVCTNCLTFSADKPFGIFIQNGLRTQPLAPAVNLEWSTDQKNWSEYKTRICEEHSSFTGYQAVQDSRDGLYKLYLRGTNNTQFATQASNGRYANKITNTVNSVARKIACSGNIETLLDWKTVARGEHPKMGYSCFYYLFCNMASLTTAPDLPAMNLSTNCYNTMFQYCYSLTNAPAVLPATTLAQGCYQNMFKYSTSLTKAPKIAAMNQAKNACNGMFFGTALKVPPKLGATNIVENCYQSMLQKTQIELKTTGPGKPWKIPAAAAESASTANKWSHNMFSNTTSEASLLMNIEAGKQYYVASATPVTLTVTAVEGASKVTVVNDGDEVSGSSPYTVYQYDEVSVTYTADKGYTFPDGKTTWTTNFTMGADAITVTLTEDQLPQPPPPVEIDVKVPEHATVAVYSNEVAAANIVEKGGTVVSNSIAYVVYTIDNDKGWYFKGDVWVKAITNQLDTTVNPAVDNNEIPDTIEVTCERKVITSDTTISDGIYTAAPSPENGGAFDVSGGTLTGTNVTFSDNSAAVGGAIHIDENGAGKMNGIFTLATAGDTIANNGTLIWNLADGNKGCLSGYDKLKNDGGTLQIMVDDAIAAPTNIVIATGDFSKTWNKNVFTITNAQGGAAMTATIDGAGVGDENVAYALKLVEQPAGSGKTNLVLAAFEPVCRLISYDDVKTNYFETVAEAVKAVGSYYRMIQFLRSAEIDAAIDGKSIDFDLNGQCVTNKHLKVSGVSSSFVGLYNSVADKGGLVNVGVVEMTSGSILGMSDLDWGEGGLLQSPDGSGKFVIADGGQVTMKGLSPNWMEANAPGSFADCETGAKVCIGTVAYVKKDSGIWATDSAIASTKVASTGTYGQGTIYYDEMFTDLQKAIDSVTTNGTVTMLKRADTSSISVTNDYACTLELNGKNVMANSGSLTVRSPLTICDDSDSQGTVCIANRIVAYTNLTIKSGKFCVMDGMLHPGINAIDVKDGAIVYISGGTFEYAKPNESNIVAGCVCYQTANTPAWQVSQGVLLSNVGIDGTSNTVTVAGYSLDAGKDSYLVPSNQVVTITYKATDDYMIGLGWKEKIVTLDADKIGNGYAMTDAEKPVVEPRWVDGDGEAGGREIALDTRERIVVADLSDIQPIAYSTNAWGAYPAANWVRIYTNATTTAPFWLSKREDGYEEWLPQVGAYGKYDFSQKWAYQVGTLQDVVYGTTNTTVWYGQNYQFVFDEDQMIYVERPGDEYGLGNLEDITSYTILNLKATPEYTNVDRYEFVTWKAYSYAERDDGWKTPEECSELAACFGDINAAETTFEMPFTNVFLTCSYQWKSNYNEVVSVEPGIYNAWEIHEGEKYNAGIATTNGSIVSFRETITTCFPVEVPLDLAAGATNIWDFTKNGRPCLTYFSRIKRAEASAIKMILFDGTLTNNTYKIAGFASEAVGDTFLISDGSSAKECTVVAQSALETSDWTYVGTKRFKLYRMVNNLLMLKVETGIMQNIVIADDFSANPPFENWNEEDGTFTWNGQVWTNGVNAFTSFTELFTNDTYATGATNISVFGSQTIAVEPITDMPWSLNLVAYTDADGNEVTPVLTVAKDSEVDDLVNITNALERITGAGTIVLGKIEGTVDPSIYNPYFAPDANIAVMNVGTEPEKKGGDIEIKVDDKAKVEKGEKGKDAIVLPGTENLNGNVNLAVQSGVTNDTLVAGKVEAPNGTVTIENHSLEELSLPNAVKAQKVVIVNNGRASGSLYSPEGSIMADNVAALGDVTITNSAHLEAEVTAGGKLQIYNNSKNTIVGTYAGESIELTGQYGSISNVIFTSDTSVMMTGDNLVTGPFTIDAAAVTNSGRIIWDLRNDNHTPHLADFDAIVQESTATFAIYADDEPVLDTYILADNAAKAKDVEFSYSEAFVDANLIANGEWVYPGNSRGYMLEVNAQNQLVLTVDWGISPEARAEYVASVSNAAKVAIAALDEVVRLNESEKQSLAAKIQSQCDAAVKYLTDKDTSGNYLVNVPNDAKAKVAETQKAIAAIVAEDAEAAAEGLIRFEQHVFDEVIPGTSMVVRIYGGSTNCSTAVKLSFVCGTYTSRPKAYVGGKRVSFPITLDWPKGDREPKEVTLKFSKSVCKTDRFFTLQLGSEVAAAVGTIDVATFTVVGKTADTTPYVRALAWPANGGRVYGSRKLSSAKSKATLQARANSWAKFAGWYKAKADNPDEIDLENGFVTDNCKLKVTQAEAGTYFAYFANVLPVIAVDDFNYDSEEVKGIYPGVDATNAICVVGQEVVYCPTFTVADGDMSGKLSISGLPSGLKYSRKTGLITGKPRYARTYTVKLTGKNKAGKHVLKIVIKVVKP